MRTLYKTVASSTGHMVHNSRGQFSSMRRFGHHCSERASCKWAGPEWQSRPMQSSSTPSPHQCLQQFLVIKHCLRATHNQSGHSRDTHHSDAGWVMACWRSTLLDFVGSDARILCAHLRPLDKHLPLSPHPRIFVTSSHTPAQ